MHEATPRIDDVRTLRRQLQPHIVETPVMRCASLEQRMGAGSRVSAKLEFLQQTGTFKARGALSVVLSLDDEQRAAGITAVSAGNHAIAAAFAARVQGISAKVVMLGSANPLRIATCRSFGAEVTMVDDVHEAFAVAEAIQRDEGRYFVHPFEGPKTFLGTATVGLEVCEQMEDLDALIVSIGGGGLCAGIASAVKQLRPDVTVIGVEPAGANSMQRSFDSGKPETLEKVDTIADSLGAPFAMPLSFALCRENVDQLVTVSDQDISDAMRYLFHSMKIAVEPACAASTAALLGPLAEQLRGKATGLIMCGSNIDWATFCRHSGLA